MTPPTDPPPGEAPDTNPALGFRRSMRHPFHPERPAQLVVCPSYMAVWTRVRDLSAGGVGLVHFAPLQPGTVIALQMLERTGLPRCLLARVVYATPREGGDWFIGCAWREPLREDDLEALLSEW